MQALKVPLALLTLAALAACTPKSEDVSLMAPQDKKDDGKKTETITLGGGCFWCIEAVFQEVKGVVAVESGYSNGNAEHPSYEEVCTGKTNCAEVCQIKYDPSVIDFNGILKVFFKVHDPTTLNYQGPWSGAKT